MTQAHGLGDQADVLIVGGGLMGAAVTRLLREADNDLDIVMVDAGPEIGSVPGQHLHDSPEPEIWSRYNEMISSGIQSFYVGDFPQPFGPSPKDAEPGMYSLSELGEDGSQMSGAALGWNAGGMGVHWSAATPTPPLEEVPDFISSQEWEADLAVAQRLLRVNEHPFADTPISMTVREKLNKILVDELHASRPVIDMPMAAQPNDHGILERTGPNVIFAPIRTGEDSHFVRHGERVASRLEVRDGRVAGAWIHPVDSDQAELVRARVTVVCADTMRTPQLLFASGIRPAALGRYLNEHAMFSAQTLVDLDRCGLTGDQAPQVAAGEYAVAQYWVPPNGDRLPGMGQFGDYVYRDDDGNFLAYACGLSFYVLTDINPDNRLEFSEDEVDVAGMPRIRVHFNYSDADRARIEQVREIQDRIGKALGTYDPAKDSGLLPPGASLHFTGTVRMGQTDDGTSVCDTNGAVWGVQDLFVAGNGVVPTAVSCNVTLTGMTLAVRTARGALAAVLAHSSSGGRGPDV